MFEVRLDKALMFSMCMHEYVENEGTREREQTHEHEGQWRQQKAVKIKTCQSGSI